MKRRFREGKADLLLCTDAAAEGLNFQFCGAMVNYDMPWNPMRVEQRIGRIDRLGQKYPTIRVVNLHYQDTVEADVYMALRSRIKLFESVVGRLQPILSQLPRTITETVLRGGRATEEVRAMLASDVRSQVDAMEAEHSGLDLDFLTEDAVDMPARRTPALNLAMLDAVIRREDARPPEIIVREMSKGEYAYIAPGMDAEVRVTTDARYFEEHAETVELWSPGSPLFPNAASLAANEQDQAEWPLYRWV